MAALDVAANQRIATVFTASKFSCCLLQKFALPAPDKVAGTCEDVRLRVWEDSLVWLPLQRPSSLSLETCCSYRHRTPVPQLGQYFKVHQLLS